MSTDPSKAADQAQPPPYNPGAPQYANHQGYAFPPPPTAPAQSTGVPASASSSTGHASKASAASTTTHHRFGFADKLSALGAKAASPINQLANKMGSEGFLPDTMDKECEKAARVLQGFCKHGIYAETEQQPTAPAGATTTSSSVNKKTRTIVTIPAKVIQKAVGLAIFTTGRVGFHLSGATGSGVLLARLPDGSWSPPSGIQIHSVGAGFVIGADIYDCVLVLNSQEAVDAFRSTRLSLGSDLAVVAGPYGAGGSVDIGAAAERKTNNKDAMVDSKGKGKASPGEAATAAAAAATTTQSPPSSPPPSSPPPKSSALRSTINKASYAYIKSRGFYAGVKVDGTVVTERQSANAAFYGSPVSVASILRGEVPASSTTTTGTSAWKPAVQVLLDTVRAAEARSTSSVAALAAAAAGAAAVPRPQSPLSETWANAAPATVIHPDSSSYPQAPAATAAAAVPPPPPAPPAAATDSYQTIEADVASTYVTSTAPAATAAPTTQAYSKAQEAAAEAAAARAAADAAGPPPPGYEYSAGPSTTGEASGHSDLPPAYEHIGPPPAGTGDSKTSH